SPTDISTLSLHDALPILTLRKRKINVFTYFVRRKNIVTLRLKSSPMQRKRELHTIHVHVLGSVTSYSVKGIADKHLLPIWSWYRSEEHTSELQSRENLVC